MAFLRSTWIGLWIGLIGMFLSTPVPAQDLPAKKAGAEERDPPAVKLAEKKFTWNRRLYQNLVTRFNYYYNAHTKFEEALRRIEKSNEDDYLQLLPLEHYDLAKSALVSDDLDSVITKASIAIQIHDPRGKWIDDCYLLIGKAYYFKKDYANAFATFQFINTRFAPRPKGETEAIVGTIGYAPQQQISVATKEKTPAFWGLARYPESRNEALLWEVRCLQALQQYPEAQSLLTLLQNDPQWPARLKGELATLQATQYLLLSQYDNALSPLREAWTKARGAWKNRLAFLLGQLYSGQHQKDTALYFFNQVLEAHPPPLMELHARLNIAQLKVEQDNNGNDESLRLLLQMVKEEKYAAYQGQIYRTLAEVALMSDTLQAIEYLRQSLAATSLPAQKLPTYQQLADLLYARGAYLAAKQYYDSAATQVNPLSPDLERIKTRRKLLTEITARLQVIARQDSLQRLARLPEAARNAFLQKIIDERQRATQQNTPLDNNPYNTLPAFTFNNPLATNNATEQGEWYFYNASSKSLGFTEFKRKWGNRPLADNWRLSTRSNLTNANNALPVTDTINKNTSLNADVNTLEALTANLPLTPEKMKASEQQVMEAYYELGLLYRDKLNDQHSAIRAFETLLQRYPDNPFAEETRFALYHLYLQAGHPDLANSMKASLLNQFPSGKFARYFRTGSWDNAQEITRKTMEAFYDTTYQAFRSGNYETVLQRKKMADSLFQNNPLQPQWDLLGIMAMVKSQPDSTTKAALTNLIRQYPNHPVKDKAEALLAALNNPQNRAIYPGQLPTDSIRPAAPPLLISSTKQPMGKDSTTGANNPPPAQIVLAKVKTPYHLNEKNPHFVILSFKKTNHRQIEVVQEQFSQYNLHRKGSIKIAGSLFVIQENKVLLIFRLFPNESAAIDYYDEIRDQLTSIAPALHPRDYDLFFISRDNFILMNNTKDVEGYLQFFREHYTVE